MKSPRNPLVIIRDSNSIILPTSFFISGLNQPASPQRTQQGEWRWAWVSVGCQT